MNSYFSQQFVWKPILLLRDHTYNQKKVFFRRHNFLSTKDIQEYQFKAFKRILNFAYENIAFYKKKYQNANVHPSDIRSIEDVEKIPTICKKELVANQDEIYNPKYSGKKYRRATSGSSGDPFVFYKDETSLTIMDVILYRSYSTCGVSIGDRQGRFWGIPLNRNGLIKTQLMDFVLNRTRLSAFRLEDRFYRVFLRKLYRKKIQYLYGYAQTIFQFAQYLNKNRIYLSDLKLKAVILTAEMVFPKQVEMMRLVFACDIRIEYGCTEVGVIGFSCQFGNIHLMENLLTQIQFENGESSTGEIIVSELYGSLFPFIRYKTGDRGLITDKPCKCGQSLLVLNQLTGRSEDFIKCPNGTLVDAYVVEYVIDQMPSRFGLIGQFFIVQDQINQLKINISLNTDFIHPEIENYLIEELYKVLPKTISIVVRFNKCSHQDSSGKRRCFVSEVR